MHRGSYGDITRTMVKTYILLVVFSVCYVSSVDGEELFKHSVVIPQAIHRWTRSVDGQSEEKDGAETVSYSLIINNRKHLLHLKQNRDFLHPEFVQLAHDAGGSHTSSYPKPQVHCFYHGEVEGYEDSLVALSTCSGLRGVIILGNETYGLEPVPQSATNEHLLYLLRDVQSDPVTCGVVDEAASSTRHEPFEPGQSLTSLLRRKRNLPDTRYVELVLVVDNLRYIFKKQNETAVREEMVELANLLDGYYKPLNIRVVLVGLEIFKDVNPFSVDGSAGDVLGRFVKWRKTSLFPRIRNDVGQLIVGRPSAFEGGVLGMAFVGTVCSVANSGGISVFRDDRLPFTSTVVAHEMGHNLGMNHDETRCKCDGKFCIMAGVAGGTAKFSRCSADDFESLVRRGGGECLKNQPSSSDVIGTAECGNDRLDEGEQCDCGKPEECNNKCCDPTTCRFTPGAACAQGDCCDNCQIRVAGTPCRKSVNTCDLPEYCDGVAASCPEDFYIMDGLSCHNAYCYEGRCQTYDFQCQNLFAQAAATKADDVCFQHANTQGNLFGNCGRNGKGNFIKCSVANAMCGKVQCTNVDLGSVSLDAHVSFQTVLGSTCVNADFNMGTDVLDPAYVNPGSPCDEGKTCLDFQCLNASALLADLDCDARVTCNGRGVCNNEGHCHCENGWAPPSCDKGGRGGSVDSGPAMIDHSVRNVLLILFLLVVPVLVLLILGSLFLCRRDSLNACLKGGVVGRFKSNNAQDAYGQSDGNVQTTTHPPAQEPPERPGYPPAVSVPSSGNGHFDYWNTDPSDVYARPPAPKQGPGVPRPIPPKQLPN